MINIYSFKNHIDAFLAIRKFNNGIALETRMYAAALNDMPLDQAKAELDILQSWLYQKGKDIERLAQVDAAQV